MQPLKLSRSHHCTVCTVDQSIFIKKIRYLLLYICRYTLHRCSQVMRPNHQCSRKRIMRPDWNIFRRNFHNVILKLYVTYPHKSSSSSPLCCICLSFSQDYSFFFDFSERTATVCDNERRFNSTFVNVLLYICGHHGFPRMWALSNEFICCRM